MKRVFVCLSLAIGLFSGAANAQVAGERVVALWAEDGFWYPARIQSVDRQVHVIFDDRSVAAVRKNEVRSLDWRAGTQLECNWQNKGQFFAGTITTIRGESIFLTYNDGDTERLTVRHCRARYRAAVDQGRTNRR